MKTLQIRLDDKTYEHLVDVAGRDLRQPSTFVLILLRQAFGLSFPYEESPLLTNPGLIPKIDDRPKSRTLRLTTETDTSDHSLTTETDTSDHSLTTETDTSDHNNKNGSVSHPDKGKRQRTKTHDAVEAREGGIPDGE